jgi:hypothetical protein
MCKAWMMNCSDLLAHLDLPEFIGKVLHYGIILELFVESEKTLMNGIRMAREKAEQLHQ